MGITGLIPFLEKASSRINVKDLAGQTVAIDTYCWLHKGAFGCAEKLSRGEDTTVHIQYCLKYVKLFLLYNVKPILVFDGRHLPAKAQTELKRRENRKAAKQRALELLRIGKHREARSYLQRCVDITHEMALQLIQECRKMNVDCIVGPYEADAQMAYLNKINIAQYVVTEDSDLVLFGCSNILFKLDLNGQCLMIEASKIPLAMGCKPEKYTFDKFRQMCILSGCDYVDSLPGIGLAKSCKFVLMTEETDMKKALKKIPSYLNMKNLEVTDEYIEDFLKADATFKHMYVYDPLKRTMVRLHELEEFGTDIEYCSNAGTPLDDDVAFQLALGNLNPFTMKQLDNWNPDNQRTKVQTRHSKGQQIVTTHKSIWQRGFTTTQSNKRKTERNVCAIEFKKMNYKMSGTSTEFETVAESKHDTDLLSLYKREEPPNKKQCLEESADEDESMEKVEKSPLLATPGANRHNPFAKTTPDLTSPVKPNTSSTSLLKIVSPVRKELSIDQRMSLQRISKFERTVADPSKKVLSRFFSSNVAKAKGSVKLDETQASSGEKKATRNILQLKKSKEQKALEEASLYLSSPEAVPASRGDTTPPRCTTPTDDSTPLRPLTPSEVNQRYPTGTVLFSLDSGISISSRAEVEEAQQENVTSILEKFEFRPTQVSQVNEENVCEALVISSGDESEIKVSPKKKAKPVTRVGKRRVGLPKTKSKSTDVTQPKLSMFGFQKRPSLK